MTSKFNDTDGSPGRLMGLTEEPSPLSSLMQGTQYSQGKCFIIFVEVLISNVLRRNQVPEAILRKYTVTSSGENPLEGELCFNWGGELKLRQKC